MQSQGGFVRVLMNFIPAIIYVLFYKRIKNPSYERVLWIVISLICIISLPFLFLGFSTAIDRINLYFTPIQMVVYGKLLYTIKEKNLKYMLITTIVFGYFLVLYVWLNYAVHKECWIPYKNILLM